VKVSGMTHDIAGPDSSGRIVPPSRVPRPERLSRRVSQNGRASARHVSLAHVRPRAGATPKREKKPERGLKHDELP